MTFQIKNNNSSRTKSTWIYDFSISILSYRSPIIRLFFSVHGTQETPIKLAQAAAFQRGMLLNAEAQA